MILSLQSKPLKQLYEKGDASKLPADHLVRITNVLTRLDAVKRPEEMNTPGSDYHQLKGDRKDFYSVKVKANWKIIFRFEGEDALDVDYLDYH
ncbi:type II toxin-antitoxin system RelE/ParE family toxin [Hymenobacter agri]|uniref:Plasmid maintenance system killer n=1 Tax=Hymenobacter jeollabukensis TaxID=2025313 RepID=A0A5R8WIH7_9BACT|nr:type II toxin-antitoxin system RelE/ParE family toxin [Hymenobacter jeollabukensis]TLM88434.1 plasmid maintenance system killer [Hymenobacter jeollabukensis]